MGYKAQTIHTDKAFGLGTPEERVVLAMVQEVLTRDKSLKDMNCNS